MTAATEETPLVINMDDPIEVHSGYASSQKQMLTVLLGSIQAALLILFLFGTTYSSALEYSPSEYVIARDIMVMLLLGFGFLMTFLRKYGLGAVGFTLLLSSLAIQLNVFMELLCRFIDGKDTDADDTQYPLPLRLSTLIDGEFAAATLLISYGAIIGRATPVQLVILALCQSFFYAFNKVVVVFGLWGAEDVGGSMTIHCFGAYFGLAVSYVLGPPLERSSKSAHPNVTSDLTTLIGTTLLWVYWPSFVGATETAVPANEQLCVLHTILALLGSTLATFYLSQTLCKGKFDPVHVANSTLAGGVAVGSSARLAMTPGGALVLGTVAGLVSVYGYVYSTPYLQDKYNIYDTCGVGNLHGWPSVLGGLASIVYVALDSDAEFLLYGGFDQCVRQFMAVVSTLLVAGGSGFLTGMIMKKSETSSSSPDEYHDGLWWEAEYFEEDTAKSE